MERKIEPLVELLKELLDSSLKNVREFMHAEYKKRNGVYAIYDKNDLDNPIYIGKTERQKEGMKGRMNNLLGDYLSHTLNLKLLCDKILNWDRKLGRKEIIIRLKTMPKEESKKYRKEVKNYIENTLRVRFKELDKDISRFEHFAIGVLNPPLND